MLSFSISRNIFTIGIGIVHLIPFASGDRMKDHGSKTWGADSYKILGMPLNSNSNINGPGDLRLLLEQKKMTTYFPGGSPDAATTVKCSICSNRGPISRPDLDLDELDNILGNEGTNWTCGTVHEHLKMNRITANQCNEIRSLLPELCGCEICQVCEDGSKPKYSSRLVYDIDRNGIKDDTCGGIDLFLTENEIYSNSSECKNYQILKHYCGCQKAEKVNFCSICFDGSTPTHVDKTLPDINNDGQQEICGDRNGFFIPDNDKRCEIYRADYANECGCPEPPELPRWCTICADGSKPFNSDYNLFPLRDDLNPGYNLFPLESEQGNCENVDLLFNDSNIFLDSSECSYFQREGGFTCQCEGIGRCNICPGGIGALTSPDKVIPEYNNMTCSEVMSDFIRDHAPESDTCKDVQQHELCPCANCTELCADGTQISEEFYNKEVYDGMTCEDFERFGPSEAMSDESQKNCYDVSLEGYLKCGCSALPLGKFCTPCDTGNKIPESYESKVVGIDDQGFDVTCLQIAFNAVKSFGSDECAYWQQYAKHFCGCPRPEPSDSPSSLPSLSPSSAALPSSSPTSISSLNTNYTPTVEPDNKSLEFTSTSSCAFVYGGQACFSCYLMLGFAFFLSFQ